jgi:hypothetical protein
MIPADGVHIVVSQPPPGVSDAEFNRWYDAHLDEILSVKGFRSARRFQLEPVVGEGALPFRFICVYETDGDPREAVAELERAGMSSRDSYAEIKDADAGALPLPDWWDQVEFASWNLQPLGERREPRT